MGVPKFAGNPCNPCNRNARLREETTVTEGARRLRKEKVLLRFPSILTMTIVRTSPEKRTPSCDPPVREMTAMRLQDRSHFSEGLQANFVEMNSEKMRQRGQLAIKLGRCWEERASTRFFSEGETSILGGTLCVILESSSRTAAAASPVSWSQI